MADRNYVQGKVVIVTGAAGGFGRLVCEKTAALGAKVVCGDIDGAALEVAVKDLTARGADAIGLATDVTRIEQVRAELEHVGLFDGEYHAFNVVGVNRPWTLQRRDGGPWRISSHQGI